MTEKANCTVVVGSGADAKTIPAGEKLPALSADEMKRLREIGAIEGQAPAEPPADVAAEPIARAGDKVKAKT